MELHARYMKERSAAIAGITAAAVFWSALWVFGAVRQDYSHVTQAISELGAIGAPHALAWNLIGFIITGLLLAIGGAGFAFAIDGRRSVLWWLVVVSGLGFAGAGIIPAEMRDGSPNLQSSLTVCHILMAFVSGIPWLIASVLLISRIKLNPKWRSFKGMGVMFAVFGIVAYTLNLFAYSLPFLSQRPGLAQRFLFAVYFAWFLVLSFRHLRESGSKSGKNAF